MDSKVLLIILDGWGIGKIPAFDAIAQANTPFYDKISKENPHALLKTFGEDVGLPDGQMGNSEVGHMNIGAGRVVYQDLLKVNKAIEGGTFDRNSRLQSCLEKAYQKGKIHLMGLLSDGGVHAHIAHLKALTKAASAKGIEEINLHCFLDGRDTKSDSATKYILDIQEFIEDYPAARLVSLVGRYYAMDRDHRWERTKLAYDLLLHGEGEYSEEPVGTVEARYANGEYDEFITPILLTKKEEALIHAGDSVLCFNFRSDRPRQIIEALSAEISLAAPADTFPGLALDITTMTEYSADFENVHVLYPKEALKNTLGEVLSERGKTQLRIAETEKYPHVTYFFSGGKEKKFDGEERILIPSPKVATYDLQPEMSAPEVTDACIAHLLEKSTDFICLNYANTDMVGHTGVWEAAVAAAEQVDSSMQKLSAVARDKGYKILIIADHGNADLMKNPDGSPHTYHTTNLVPIILCNAPDVESLEAGRLCDIAPTILGLLETTAPESMSGKNLCR